MADLHDIAQPHTLTLGAHARLQRAVTSGQLALSMRGGKAPAGDA